MHSQGAVSPAGERLIAIPFSTLDLTPPALSAPLVSDITDAGAKLALTSSEAGKIYYMAQDASAMMPNKASIVSKGQAESASAQTPVQVALSGLASGSAFKVYAVAKDQAGNYSDVMEASFSTLSSSSSDAGNGGTSSSSSDAGNGGSSSSSSDAGNSSSSSSGGGTEAVLGGASGAGQPLYYEVISTVGERVRQGALPPGQDVRSIKGLSRGRYIVLLRRGSALNAVRLDVAE